MSKELETKASRIGAKHDQGITRRELGQEDRAQRDRRQFGQCGRADVLCPYNRFDEVAPVN